MSVILSLRPWDSLVNEIGKSGSEYSTSPFVMIFSQIGIPSAAIILNFVILTAAISVYNSCVFCNSRMLYGLAIQGNAPKALTRVDKRGVPIPALLLSSFATLVCVLINYFAPDEAMKILMTMAVAALLINWTMISLSHLKFRKYQDSHNVQT